MRRTDDPACICTPVRFADFEPTRWISTHCPLHNPIDGTKRRHEARFAGLQSFIDMTS